MGPDGDLEAVGVIGVLCEAETTERVVRKTPSGPLHRAVCNRWHGHGGWHRQVRGRDFKVLHVWNDAQCRTPDWKEARRKEMALAKAASRD